MPSASPPFFVFVRLVDKRLRLVLLLTAVFLLSLLCVQAIAPPVLLPTVLAPEQAMATAVNQVSPLADGLQLQHPRHIANFTADGLFFQPRRGGPTWKWQLAYAGTAVAPLGEVALTAVLPTERQPGIIAYDRGALIEQYVAGVQRLEQQFILPAPLPLSGADLVIMGDVYSDGEFTATAHGWAWRSLSGVVSLGDVTVLDAQGRQIPATFTVTAVGTRLIVDGAALAQAAYPVLIDPEIGANDFPISHMGYDYDFDVALPAVAFNSTDNEFYVVWEGDTETETLVNGEFEIYGRRINAITGAPLGGATRLSETGTDGLSGTDAKQAAVAYNSINNQYLVVWLADANDGEFETYGQFIDAKNGAEIGSDIRLSDMGPDGNINYEVELPDVAYNSTNNEYLVVWSGEDGIDEEFEIYGQRVNAVTGVEIGLNDMRLSDMGPDGDIEFDTTRPAVAYNSVNNEYLVVWRGDDNTAPFVAGENEIFGQRVNGINGAELGANDFLVSQMGEDGKTKYDADDPDVAYNSTDNEYFVVWSSDDDRGGVINDDLEIFGQRLSAATGAEVGTNDMRLSQMGEDGFITFAAVEPAVAYNSINNEYLVVWQANNQADGLDPTEVEVYGQRVNAASGLEIGGDLRLSDMGPDGDPAYTALSTAVTFAAENNHYYVVWYGDDNTDSLLDDEYEVFGQQIDGSSGNELGPNDRRITHMGPLGYPDLAAFTPAIAYNSSNNEFLVVWSGSTNEGDLGKGEDEIFGQRLSAGTGELLSNRLRLSDMGPNGTKSFDAYDPDIVYNSVSNEYFVVWVGDDNTGTVVDEEFEVYGQRVNAITGAEIGFDIRLSDMGQDGNIAYAPDIPAVAYNSTDNQYLVVWLADDVSGLLADDEFEIFGQSVTATGVEIGIDIRLSDMGPDGSFDFNASAPDVAYNSQNNEYLVVWSGDDNTVPLVDGETEIFGQRVNGKTGAEVGANDMRLSDMGPNGIDSYDGRTPAVTYNDQDNEYFVVWSSEDNTGTLAANEIEIFGQRLNAATGVEVGLNDMRISFMGQDGNLLYAGQKPVVAYNLTNNDYLVVWQGDDNVEGLVDEDFEIYGQVLTADGTAVEDNFRLSDMGQNGNVEHIAQDAALAYSTINRSYLIVWSGDDDTGEEIYNGFEIFGQRYLSGGTTIYLPLVTKK